MQRRTKLAFGVLFLFSALFLLVLVGLVRLVSGGNHVQVPDNALLVLHLNGSYEDAPPGPDFQLPFLESGPNTLQGLRETLDRARDDRRIRGVVVNVWNLNVGWGVAQELREALQAFRSSGKPLTAFMETASDKDYYVAVAADKVYLAPEGMLLLNGLSMDAQFIKDTLEKLGVEADYHNIGEYKTAVEMYTRSNMSPAHREALSSILDSLYSQMLAAIGEGRKLTREEVAAYIDDFTISGSRLVEAKMVDGLMYYDEVLDSLKQPGEEEASVIELGDYSKASESTIDLETGPKIAVLYVSGEIHSGESGRGGMFGGESVGSDTILEAARAIRKDDDIKALVLRVNSPGGSSLAADQMWRELMRTKKKMPIVVSMSDLAASGGYWIATAGDTIVAQPGTITGSIGVFMGKLNLAGLMDKVGVEVETVSRGRYAEMFSPFKKFNPDELKKVDAMLSETYETFLNKVSVARNMTRAEVDAVARGRVWTGEQARERKLVDELGGMDRAIALAREKANLAADSAVRVVAYPRDESFFGRIMGQLGVHSSLELRSELRPLQTLLKSEEMAMDPGPQALLPFIPNIQ